MPTYRNDGTKPAVVGSEIIGPGIGPVAVKKYAHPDQADLVLVSHEPRTKTPVLLFGDTLPSGAILDLAAYDEIQVYNQSGADISIVYNEYSAHTDIWPDGTRFAISGLSGNYYSLTITGAGSGNVYVYGIEASSDNVRGMPMLSRVS